MSARVFLAQNKFLWPLFAGVGTAIVGGVYMLYHTAANCPDVVLNKSADRSSPWNRVEQHQSPKLYNAFPEFFNARKGMAHPHAAFLDEKMEEHLREDGNYIDAAKRLRYYRPIEGKHFEK